MRGMNAIQFIVTVIVCSLLVPAFAFAEQCPETGTAEMNRQNASDAFDEAQRFIDAEDYRNALPAFECSNSLHPHHVILFHIARCHEELDDFQAAVRVYREYLELYPDETEGRAIVETRLRDVEARISRDEPTPEPLASPEDDERQTTGSTSSEPSYSAEGVATPVRTNGRTNPVRRWAWITLGLGLVLGGTGAGLVGGASSVHQEFESSSDQILENPVDLQRANDELDDLESRGRALQVSGWIMTGVGSALLFSSLVLFLVRPAEEQESASSQGLQIAAGPLGFELSGVF
jgi:hypothetical protein